MTTTTTDNNLVNEYIASFTEQQHHVMNVAIEKLGSSFNLSKSNGFKKWLTKRVEKPAPTPQPDPQPAPAPTPQPQPATQPTPTKKKVRVVKRKKSDKDKVKDNDPAPTPTPMFDKLSKLFDDAVSSDQIKEFLINDETIELLKPSNSSLYCIYTETTLMFVGTTSDTYKNFKLAYKSVAKKLNSKHNEPNATATTTTSTITLYGLVIPIDDSKTRIRLRDKIKKNIEIS